MKWEAQWTPGALKTFVTTVDHDLTMSLAVGATTSVVVDSKRMGARVFAFDTTIRMGDDEAQRWALKVARRHFLRLAARKRKSAFALDRIAATLRGPVEPGGCDTCGSAACPGRPGLKGICQDR